MGPAVDRRSFWQWLVGVALLAVVLTIDFVVLRLMPIDSLETKISMVLGAVGIYSLLVGVISSTDVHKSIIESITSHNLAEYLVGNLLVLASASTLLGNAVDPRRVTLQPSRWGTAVLRRIIVSGLVFPASFLYMLFHVIVVLPFAYLAYAPASLAVSAALDSARPQELEVKDNKTGEEKKLLGVEWVRNHRVQATSFAVALPSSTITLLLQIV